MSSTTPALTSSNAQQPAEIGAGSSAGHTTGQRDAVGFTGPDPSGMSQSGAGAPDLTDDQGTHGTQQAPKGIGAKIKQAFSVTEPDGTPKKTA